MENINTQRQIFLLLPKLGCGLQEFDSRKFHQYLTFKVSWNNRDDIEKMQIHFYTEIFAAVAVIVA